jgi:hypothetical protein
MPGPYGASEPGSVSAGGNGLASGEGSGGSGSAFATAARIAARAGSWAGSVSATSHSQQSLQRRHLSQMWLSQASLVHRRQIPVDASPQMLHVYGMGAIISFSPRRA